MSAMRASRQRFASKIAAGFCLAATAGMAVWMWAEFGPVVALVVCLLFALPLIVAVRLSRRQVAARYSELVYLAVLFCFVSGLAGMMVRSLYANGMDENYRESVKWARFERQMREDPAFADVSPSRCKLTHMHVAYGTVEKEDDIDRLKRLAAEFGIDEGPPSSMRKFYVNVKKESAWE